MAKPLYWVGQSRKDLRMMPEHVQDTFGFALWLAQQGKQHPQSKPLKGFGSAGVIEVVEDFHGNTWRAVYTIKSEGRYTYCTLSRKSLRRVKQRPSLTSILFTNG